MLLLQLDVILWYLLNAIAMDLLLVTYGVGRKNLSKNLGVDPWLTPFSDFRLP